MQCNAVTRNTENNVEVIKKEFFKLIFSKPTKPQAQWSAMSLDLT